MCTLRFLGSQWTYEHVIVIGIWVSLEIFFLQGNVSRELSALAQSLGCLSQGLVKIGSCSRGRSATLIVDSGYVSLALKGIGVRVSQGSVCMYIYILYGWKVRDQVSSSLSFD